MGNYVKVKGAETGKTYNVTAEDFSKFYDDYVANSAGATVEMYDMDGNKKSVGIADAKDMYGQGYTYWQGQHNYHAGKIRAAEARKKAAEEEAKEKEPANAVSQAKQMVKPQKPAAETAKQETPTPAAEAPKAAENTAVPKQEKKRQPLTEAEKMEMMYGSTMQNIAGTVAKTDHAIDEVKAQTKIAAKPIQADRKIKLGENRKTIETAAFNPETGKVEKQYYDEFGNKFDNRAEADLTGNLVDQHNSELYNFDAELSSAEADLERLKSERDEARAARGKTLGILHHAPGSHSTQEETKYNLEDNAYNAAIRQAEERVKNLTEERDARNGEDVGFWRGVGRAVSDGRTWDFGIGDARDMSTMLQLQSEDGLTDSQKKARQAMMESLYKSQQTEQKYSGNRDFWYRAGTTTGMMPAFMVDFAASTLTGGSSAALKAGSKVATKVATKALGEQMVESMAKKGIKAFAKEAAKDVLTQGAGKAAAKTAARDAAKKYTANWAIKALGTTADDLLVRAPLMTNTIQVNKTYADTVSRKLGDVTRDDNGNFSFENSKSWGDAAWQGEANAIIENYSEMFGAHLDPVMTLENASKLAGTFGAKRLSELLSKGSKAGIDSAMGQTKKLFEKAGVSDYAGEVSEEYYGQLWRTMLNLDDAYIENEDGTRTNNFLNAQFHGDILGGMALSMGLISGAKAGFSAASYYKMKKDLRGYEADARVLLGDDKWDVIKATLQATTNDNIGNFIATIKNDKDLTEEDKTAVLKYTEGSMRLRGFDMGELKQKEEESQRQQWEQPNEQAATEAGHAIASQADVMGEQPNGDVVRQESQEYRDAQQALAEANKTILPKISSLDTDGLLSDVDITAVSTEGLTQVLTALPPQLRDAVTEYISIRNVADNAAIRHQAMLDGLSNSIDEAAEKHYAANMSNTDEGLSDVVEYTDEQGQLWYVRNGLTGEVTLLTNENGEVKWVPTEDIAANAFYGQSKESALDSLRTSLQEKITQEYGLAEDQQNEQLPQNATEQGEGAPQQSETQEGEQPPTAGQQEESGFVFPQRVDEEGNNVDDFTGEGVTPENALERLRTSYGMSDEDIAAWASSWRRGLQKPGAEDAEATNAYNRAKGISEGVLSLLGQQYQEEGAAEAEAAAGGAVENATEQATEQSQVPQIPTDKNGNKLYFEGSVAPKDAVDDILADLEGDMDATETAVNDELAGAQEALNKVSQEKATGIAGIKAKKAKEKEAGAVVDYWQSVADEIATRKQTARAEEEAAIKAATEKERTAAEENGQIPDWRHDTPEAARQRGFRISEGERYDRQEKIGGIEGRESKAVFTNKDGDTKDGRLMLVDINSVQESHKGSMKNPYHFIPEAQPKDRTSSASRTDTAVNAAPENFKPELLTGDGVVYNESAPIINSRGEVIQGNGRVMTMREVYKNPESAARYKQYLKEHAAEFGLTPEDIDKMEQPILVNRVDVDDAEAIRLGQFKATDLESGGSQRIEPRETIQKMGDWFRSFINKIFNGEEDESIAQLIDKNGIEVLKHMNSRGFISNTQVETAIRDGKLTAEGKNDIMNILKHHLFDGAPSELEAMFNGMPAKAQKAILSTYLRDYEVPAEAALLDDIRASIMAYHELQQEEKFNKATTYEGAKTAISDWLRQQNMFDGVANKDKFSTFALELVAREKTLSQKALTELFNTYYDMTSKSASVGGDLFSEADTKTYTKAEAIKKLFDVDIEESKNNDNELQGSNALAGDGRPRGKGRQGGSGNAASGESNAPGAGPADGGARTGRDGEEGTESVAEDDEAIKAIAAEITKGTGIEVVTGKKAQEALEEAEALGDDIKYQTSGEIDKQYPNWLDGTTNDNGKHSTQVAGTIGTYKKVAAWVESHLGKDVKILDASSGMGLGTRELREQGFNIEDVEPYQSEDRKKNNPATYSSYGDIKGKYDVIISNAVLNVIPDDWRANVLHDMANRLSDGGRLFINTRKAGEEKGIKDKIELDSPQEVLVKRNGKIASYQRFFTPKELKDWVEKELGDGYEVEVANEKNSGTKGLAAVVVTKKTSPETVAPIPSDNVNASVVSRDAAAKVQQNLDTTKSHYEKASNRTRGFITDVSKALGLTQHGASQYGTFVSKDGKQFTIRISNHNTRATTFDENGENEGISIVISGSRNYGIRDKENTRAHVVEFFYPKKAIERAVGKPLVSIIESIKETLDTGVYKDKTGLAKPDEVDGTTRKEFRTKNGEVYGFTDGEKIYLDTKKMKKDTPLHEYAHLWCDALRRGNPEEWGHVKSLFDSVEGLKERIKETYPELEGDALYEEMITTYSGEEGTKKLEETARKIAKEEGKTLTESSKAQGFIDKVKEALKTYWKGVADMLGIHYTSAEEVADKILDDLANGVDVRKVEAKKKAEPVFSERETYIKEHPLTAEEIDAADMNRNRKARAKAYLDGTDTSELAKGSYASVYEHIQNNKPNEADKPTAPARNEEGKPSSPKPKEGNTTGGNKTESTKPARILDKTKQSRFDKLKDSWKKTKPKDSSSNFDAYKIDVLTSEQRDLMLDTIDDCADISYEMFKDGDVESKQEWKDILTSELKDTICDVTGYNDKDFNELLDDIWNSSYNESTRGETKSISEWAKDFNIKDEPIKDNDNEGNEEDGGNGGNGMGVDTGNTPPMGPSSEEGGGNQVEVSVPGNSGQNMQGDGSSDVHGGNSRSGGRGKAVAGGKHTNAGTGNSEQVRGSGRNNGGRSGSGTNNVGGVSGDDTATQVGSGVGRNTVGRNAVDLTKEKVTYVAANDPEGKHAIGSVMPSGAASAINAAFDRLVKEVKKNVAEFVRDELGYSSDEEMYNGLSSEQVDAVALAVNSMKKGKSFIIGDMTGIGKGRQAAALLRWAKHSGKKVIFVTESSKLFSDIYGDLKKTGSDYLPFIVNDDAEANITDGNGVKLVPKPNKQAKDALWQSETDELPKDKKGRQYDMLFMTYSQVQSDSKSSKEKRDWITNYAKDAIIVMDESHNASGSSKRGDFFRNIVENAAGVTFLSATYAKRPDNMLLYALRSSLSDVNMSKEAMFEAIKKYGVPMQEILAGGLFGSGEMIRRERDMTGVKTTWCKMEDTYSEEEIAKSRNTSDVTMDIINDIIDFQKTYVNPIVREIEDSFTEYNAQAAKTGQPLRHCNNTPYSSQVSNIMNLLTYGLKAQKAADMAIEQIKQGMKPVIAVENTLGSYVDEIEGNVDSASFDRIFEKGIKFALRYNIAYYQPTKLKETELIFDAYDQLPPEGLMALDRIRGRIKDYLEDEGIEQLTISPIDLVKKKLADAGYKCGEITGRTKQLIKGEDGTYHTEGLKIKKKDAAARFNGGSVDNPIPEGDRYDALILNVAGATGISLHASKEFGDQRPRSMIILQPARDVNIEVQMRGRVDRTGQVHRASFYYITSPIPAEHKITMMLKQKLASLDANTVGTEKVSSNTVEAQNMDNKYGDEVAYEYLLEHLNDVNSALGSKGITRDNKTGEWERREGLLYDVMKGIQLLPCEMQEQILEELSVRYADKIEYLNQNGINDLESSTFNLDAVTIDKAVFVKGKDNDSVNEFAHDTHIERVEANVLKKPMRSKDVVTRMKKLGSMDAEGKLDPYGYAEKIEADLKATVESMLHERREKLLAAEEKQQAKLKEALPQKEGETDEEYEARLEKQPSLAELKRKNSALIKEYDAELEKQMNDVLYPAQTLEPGMVYLVPLTDELKSDAPMSWGRFLGFEIKNGQPRSIQAVFAVKDSRASISVPCVNSKKVIEKIVNNRNDVMALDIRRNPENGSLYAASNPKAMEAVNSWWDARIPKNTNRTHRYMITGNILQACDSLGKYKGQIVTFTRKDPQTGETTTEKGMLLAENFDPENFKVRGPVTVDDVYNSDREIKDERSNISARAEGDRLVITLEKKGRMDLTKHPFMNDPELADLAMTASNGTKFSLARNSVAMMFPKKNAEKVLELLNKNYSFTKEKFFVMPDSSDKPDAIIRNNRPFQEIIDELSKKYKVDTLYAAKYEIERNLKRYKLDVDNEDLKTRIRELVQLRQAYLRERHSKESNDTLAWEKLILDGQIEGCNREIERAEDDSDLRRAKAHREDFYAEREAILEELESRGVKGKILHLKQGDLSIDDAKGLFDKLNTDKENAELMDMVYSKLKDLGLSIVLDNSIREEIAGAAGGRTIRYNWRYFNAEFVADQQKADTILHEMIHTATVYAVQCVENGDEHLLKPDMVSAVNKLEQIYNAMKGQKEVFTHNGTTQYGLTNVKEMMSEFGSNKSFREDVKKAGLWAKIISGIMEFFGFEKRGATKTSAYEAIKEHLEDLIDGFDRNAWEQTYPNYSFRRLDNMAQRKSYAQSVIDSLGGKGKVVTDAKKLDHTGKKALRQNKDMAGYYDPKTGEVVVYLPNCHSRVDIERTVQHEKIGHEGLRGLLGKDRHKKFLQKVYLGLDEAERHIINEKMMRDDKLSLYNAVDEYLAEKAEVFNDSNRSLWQRVKDVWNDTMRGLGFKQSSTEKDIRTALWLSKNRLSGNDNSLEYRIRKAAFNSSLKKYHPTEATSRNGYTYDTNDVDEDGDSMSHLLYRTKNMSDEDREAALANLTPEGRDCLRQYNDRLANWKYAWTEAHGDRLASVRELLDTILKPKKNEKIDSKYDIASKMEALGSKNQQEQEAFTRKYAKPIFKKLSELSTFFDGETPQERYRNLEAYAYVKHALERNRTLFVRDAIKKMEANDDPAIQAYSAVAQKDYDAERNRLLGELNKGNIDLRQFYSELDNYIANNIASFDAAHNDMSGLSDPDSETMKSLGISVSKKGEYNEDAALDYVMDSESKMGKSNVDEIWGMINEVSRGNVEREYNAGLINQKARDRMQSMFSWYLPLRGFDAKTSEEVYGYIGENGLSGFTANPKTKGRVSQAETPISTLLAMSDYSIFRSNKNEMKRSLVMLARDHQNNLVTEYETWYHETVDASGNKVLEASYPELREDMTAAEITKAIEDHEATISSKMESGETWVKLKDNKTNSPYRIVKQRQRNQHIVSCMIDGKQVDILIHGNPRAAQAINGLVHDTHWGAWDSVNHTLSQLMTSYSLSFMGRNKMRDLEYALASSLTENWKEGKQWNRNFAKMYAQLDFLNPLPTKSGKKEDMTGKYNDSIQGKINNMIKLFSLYRQGKLDMSNDVQRWFHEFVTNGGMTGFTSMIDRDDYDAQIQRTVAEYFDKKGSNKAIRLAQLSGEKATKLFSAYFNTVEKLNEAVENQTRFAAYCASRMERRSITRSVADAKDVSINFNRTGSGWSTHSLRTGEESTIWKINRDAAALTATYMRHTAWFYNAAIQGMVRNLKLFKDGDAAQRARFFVNMAALPMATYAVATLSSAAIAAALDGDDDKKKFGDNPLDQLPDYVRRQNFCLYTGHGRFIMIPLAIELRAMYGLADVCSRAGRGLPSEKGYGNELFEQFTQLTPYDLGGGSKVGTNGVLGSATGIVTPSNLQGLIACATNVKWTGGPVSGRSDWNASDAEWQRGLSTTSPFYVGMSRYLSTDFSNAMADAADKLGARETAVGWRGDDKGIKGGVVDINPAWAQYIVETYLGGPGKDFGEAASYLQSKASDVKEYGWSSITNDKGEADLTRTPIIKAFTRSATPNNAMATNRSRWYAYNKEYNDETKPWIKGYAKNGESLDFKMLMASKKGQIGRVVAAYSPIIKQMQARKNAATTHAEREHAQWMMNDYINRAIEMIDKIEKK